VSSARIFIAVLAAVAAVAAVAAATTLGAGPVVAMRAPVANTPASPPRCFGAAARSPGRRPCANPSLRYSVVPSPAVARTLPNSPCTTIEVSPPVCAFGVDAVDAQDTIAIVGDSHAGGLRGAVAPVARAHRWQGLSMTHSSCPLSTAVRALPDPELFQRCADWKLQVFAWFQHHPEVHTVFVAGLSGGSGVLPAGGQSRFATAVAGYIGGWNALPQTVRHIVVMRDTPKARHTTAACIERAMALRRDAGITCAVPRSDALDPDPLVVAAARMRSPRVQVVDLTRAFCSDRLCFPVIGRALIFRDVTHLTAVFAATLGPFLQRQVDGLMGSAAWAEAAR
jgi:hypothetical protein